MKWVIALLLLILLRFAMNENQRRLTRMRFFELPFTMGCYIFCLGGCNFIYPVQGA
jgi:hypothetical protein